MDMENTDSDREGRGPNAPAETLAAAVQLLQLVRDRLGLSSASRESIAEALGYRTLNGTSRRKLAALSHYDLLTRNGGVYRISDLGKQILIPRNETEQRRALAVSARKPAFYQRLFERYAGQPIPSMLPNILVREFGIRPQSSEEVARTFRESQEYAGLLKNGILLTELDSATVRATETVDPMSPPPVQQRVPADGGAPLSTTVEAGHDGKQRQRYTIPLDKQGGLATVELPIPVRERDLKKVSAWVTYMETVIDDDEEGATTRD